MNNVYEFSNLIKKKVLESSMIFFDDTAISYGVNYEFSRTAFSKFCDNLYSIYEYKNKIYKYESDMKEYLLTTLTMCMEAGRKKITLEDIRDGIFEVKTRSDDVKNISEYKMKKIQEV